MNTVQRSVQQARGFTLLELLIAVALMALLMVGMGSTLMTVAQTQTRAQHKLEQVDRDRVTIHFLRTLWSSVSPIKDASASVAAAGSQPNFFQGTAHAVQWLGVMPARFGAGGRTHFRIAVQASTQGQGEDLVLWFVPLDLEQPAADFQQARAYVLASGLESVEFAYLRRYQGESQWSAQWSHADELPHAIEVRVAAQGHVWPHTVIALYSTPAAVRGASGEAVFGGTGQ